MPKTESKVDTNEEQGSSSVPLNILIKLIPTFNGDKTKLHEFVDNCSTAYRLCSNAEKNTILEIIKCNIHDKARLQIRNRAFTDWPTLKTFLLDAYSDRRSHAQYQLELNSCRQTMNESVMEYSSRLERILLKLINTLESQEPEKSANIKLLQQQGLNVFLTGLKQELAILVKAQKPDSLEEAVGYAQSEEMEQKSKQEMSKFSKIQTTTKTCTFCHKVGHTYQTCFNRTKNVSSPFTKNTSSSFHYKNASPSFNGNASSRFINTTRVSGKFCRYCKKPNHDITECRKLQFKQNQQMGQPKQPIQSTTCELPRSSNLNSQSSPSKARL